MSLAVFPSGMGSREAVAGGSSTAARSGYPKMGNAAAAKKTPDRNPNPTFFEWMAQIHTADPAASIQEG